MSGVANSPLKNRTLSGGGEQVKATRNPAEDHSAIHNELLRTIIAPPDNRAFQIVLNTAHLTSRSKKSRLSPSIQQTPMAKFGDRDFMLVEVDHDQLFFQTISRTGLATASGVILKTIRRPPMMPVFLASRYLLRRVELRKGSSRLSEAGKRVACLSHAIVRHRHCGCEAQIGSGPARTRDRKQSPFWSR